MSKRGTRIDASFPRPTATATTSPNKTVLHQDDAKPLLSAFDPHYRLRSLEVPPIVARDACGPRGLSLLHASDEPLIDLVFVHGLGGDPMKTWCKNDDLTSFWPKSWLPMEHGMGKANIHSFGYDSEAGWESGNASNIINDLGQDLVQDMSISPTICASRKAPIVLIGHSFGGLVIKSAVNFTKVGADDFENRIQSIFFLATPHHLSDTYYPSEEPASGQRVARVLIQEVNDEFRRHAVGIPIYSFFETIPTKGRFVVEKASAVLDWPNEKARPLNANHRDMTKFESPNDPNYVSLRDTLDDAVDNLLQNVSRQESMDTREDTMLLKSFLGVDGPPDNDYMCAPGTGEWIGGRADFRQWSGVDNIDIHYSQQPSRLNSNIWVYWLAGSPGTGKTHLASHVVSKLQSSNLDCAYYFFDSGYQDLSRFSQFILSIAYQMALSPTPFRQSLVSLARSRMAIHTDSPGMMWPEILMNGLFETHTSSTEYWVIDALDECEDYRELFRILTVLRPQFPLRVFVTSRKTAKISKLFGRLQEIVMVNAITISDSEAHHDIGRYIESRLDIVPIGSGIVIQDFVDKIKSKANGSFLWVRIVLDGLLDAGLTKDGLDHTDYTLDDMLSYYQEITGAMIQKKLNTHIGQAILLWVICSARKLTISELVDALWLDISATLIDPKNQVQDICGKLVVIDRADRVNVIHGVVRELLWSEQAEILSVRLPMGHARIAMACLKVLNSAELLPPRHPSALTRVRERPAPSALISYAVKYFSRHIAQASGYSHTVFSDLNAFLKGNVLSWIEMVAESGDLRIFVRVSSELKEYLNHRRTRGLSPLENYDNIVNDLAVDLGRLATTFGETLLQEPSSIYFKIPPLCPPYSVIHRLFKKRIDEAAPAGDIQADQIPSEPENSTTGDAHPYRENMREVPFKAKSEKGIEWPEYDATTNLSDPESVFSRRMTLSTALSELRSEYIPSAKTKAPRIRYSLLNDEELTELSSMAPTESDIGDIKEHQETEKLIGRSAGYISDKFRWSITVIPLTDLDDAIIKGILGALEQVKQILKIYFPLETLKKGLRKFVTLCIVKTSEKPVDAEMETIQGVTNLASTLPVLSQTQVKDGRFSSLPDLVDHMLWFMPDIVTEPAVPAGMKRARWNCVCGARLYDDFVELEPGSVKDLQTALQNGNDDGQTNSRDSSTNDPITPLSSLLYLVKQMIKSLRKRKGDRNAPLPIHNPPGLAQHHPKRDVDISHLLYCIRNDETGLRLHQERIEDIDTDWDLMMFLRARYRQHRNPFSWLRLRHVSQVFINRFEVDASHFAQVHGHDRTCSGECVCLPPLNSINTEYRCHPAPEKKPPHVPIFGENYLIHYFRHPGCLSKTQSRIYNQLPKRICGRLAPPDDQSSHGWGVYFEEGWHMRSVFFVVVVMIVTASLVFAVAWSVLKRDVQGAFAISGCWMTLGSLLLGWAAVRSF